MASYPPLKPLTDYLQPRLEESIAFWEKESANCLINRNILFDPRFEGHPIRLKRPRPTMGSIMSKTSPLDLIEVMSPFQDEPVELWGEGFDWDEWGSYADTQSHAESVGGIPFTIHDGDDGDRDYLRIPLGRVNRWGAHIMTKASYDRLLAWSKLESPFNDYDDGQVIQSFTDNRKVNVGPHRIIPLNVQGGELVRERDEELDDDYDF